MSAKQPDVRVSDESLRALQANLVQFNRAMANIATSIQASFATWAERNRPMLTAWAALAAEWEANGRPSLRPAPRDVDTTGLVRRWFEEHPPDVRPHDFMPDNCWRCDATNGTTDVGLCAACHITLTTHDPA